MIRDAFTFPHDDYELINTVKARLLQQHLTKNKSEILRMGLKAMGTMTDAQLSELAKEVEGLKPGRPKSV